MDFVYNDYANWRMENDDLIAALFTKFSIITARIKHIYDAVDYLYNKRIEESKLGQDEENIFSFGFNYLFDLVSEIDLIHKSYYQDFSEMDKEGKTISLLLYVHDIQNELESDKKKLVQLDLFEEEILTYIRKHEIIPDEMFLVFDDLMTKLFPDSDYYGVAEIFYDIAMELNIID